MREIDTLPGRSAQYWSAIIIPRLAYLALALIAVFTVLIALPKAAFGGTGVAQLIVLTLLFATNFAGFAINFVVSPKQASKEIATGYTSLHGVHKEVAEVAPRTNIVIREPNQDFHDRASFKEAVAEAQRNYAPPPDRLLSR
jgi:hypothetical protein